MSERQVFLEKFLFCSSDKILFVQTFPSNSILAVGQWDALPVSFKENSMCSTDQLTAVKHSICIQLLPLPKSLNKGCMSYAGLFVHFVWRCEAWWAYAGCFFCCNIGTLSGRSPYFMWQTLLLREAWEAWEVSGQTGRALWASDQHD